MGAGERIITFIIIFIGAMIVVVSGVTDPIPVRPKKMMRVEVEPTSDPDFLKVTVDSGHQYLAQRYTFVNGGAGGLTHLAGCEYCKNNLSSKKIDQWK